MRSEIKKERKKNGPHFEVILFLVLELYSKCIGGSLSGIIFLVSL